MADYNTVARPYAEGVFKLAKDQGALPKWSEMLDSAAAVVSDPTLNALLGSPRVSREDMAGLVIEVCGDILDEHGKNFVKLLAQNRRLAVLPEVAEQFQALRADEEATIDVRLIAAQPVADDVKEKLAAAIGRKLDRKVQLSMETDASLLGGAIIRAGDMVIDGSVRGRLERMTATLSR